MDYEKLVADLDRLEVCPDGLLLAGLVRAGLDPLKLSAAELARLLGPHWLWVLDRSDALGLEGAAWDLSGADLGGADFRGVDLQGAVLRDAVLRGRTSEERASAGRTFGWRTFGGHGGLQTIPPSRGGLWWMGN